MKNIKNTYSEDKIYSTPRQERLHHKYDGLKFEDDFTPLRYTNRWIRRIIEKNIGKSYNKLYSYFCQQIAENKDIPRVLDGIPLTETFKDYFKPPYNEFYVENNIIKRNERRRWYKDKPSKYVYYYPCGHDYRYTIDNRYINLVRDAIEMKLGKTFYDRISSWMTEEEYRKAVSCIRSDWNLTRFIKDNCEFWRDDITQLFTYEDRAPFKRIENTERLQKQILAEEADKRNKARRDNNAKKRTIAEEWLHNYMAEHKRKEREKNKIDMERLGFDENSFIGHPYHGQKRKNNKS